MIFAFQFSTHTINVEMSLSQAYLIPVSPALCFRAFAQAMLLALSTPPLIHTHRWVPSLSAQQRGPTVLSQDTPASWLPQAGGLRLSGFGTREEPVTRQQAFSERSEAGGNPDEGESVCHLRSSRCVAAAIYGLEGWQSGGQGRALLFSRRQACRCFLNGPQTEVCAAPAILLSLPWPPSKEACVSGCQDPLFALPVALIPLGPQAVGTASPVLPALQDCPIAQDFSHLPTPVEGPLHRLPVCLPWGGSSPAGPSVPTQTSKGTSSAGSHPDRFPEPKGQAWQQEGATCRHWTGEGPFGVSPVPSHTELRL